MSQVMDSWEPADLDEVEQKPRASWEEISPDSLRRSALSEEYEVDSETDGQRAHAGLAWFEVILGALLGVAMATALWGLSGGELWFLALLPGLVVGPPLMAFKRRDLKYLGYGLLVSPVIALVLGLIFWYLTLFL
jgi:hypothetical protein